MQEPDALNRVHAHFRSEGPRKLFTPSFVERLKPFLHPSKAGLEMQREGKHDANLGFYAAGAVN